MKTSVKTLLLSCLVMSMTTVSGIRKEENMRTLQNIVYGSLVVGGTLSFIFWAPSTCNVICQAGIKEAFLTTHIPRLMIDGLTIAGGIMALYQNSKRTK